MSDMSVCLCPKKKLSSLLRFAAVVVEHLVQRWEHCERLLLGEWVMVVHRQSRGAQPMVADSLLAADALASAAHQPAGALAGHDDSGRVFAALVADALQARQLPARVQFGSVDALAGVLDARTRVQFAADLQDVGAAESGKRRTIRSFQRRGSFHSGALRSLLMVCSCVHGICEQLNIRVA